MITSQSNTRENTQQKNAGDGYSNEPNGAHDQSKVMSVSGANLIRHIKEDTMEIAGEIAAEGQHRIEDARSYAAKYLKIIEKEVMAKPVQSIAIAFATGAILSLIMGRR